RPPVVAEGRPAGLDVAIAQPRVVAYNRFSASAAGGPPQPTAGPPGRPSFGGNQYNSGYKRAYPSAAPSAPAGAHQQQQQYYLPNDSPNKRYRGYGEGGAYWERGECGKGGRVVLGVPWRFLKKKCSEMDGRMNSNSLCCPLSCDNVGIVVALTPAGGVVLEFSLPDVLAVVLIMVLFAGAPSSYGSSNANPSYHYRRFSGGSGPGGPPPPPPQRRY
ncbi:hypothetical protein FOZ62_027508, partial [Perkinsus olseni]